MADRRLTGLLLVGGASTRFGSAKALASLGGATLVERAWRLLRATCDETIAVGKNADALTLPFPLVDDGSFARRLQDSSRAFARPEPTSVSHSQSTSLFSRPLLFVPSPTPARTPP